MKNLAIVTLCTATLLTGCEAVSSRMQERFSPVPPRTRTFAATRKVVYEAGRQAVKNVGLLLGRASFAQGRIEGYAPITAGDATRDTRQTTIEISLTETDSGDTQVGLLVWEHTEGNFPGGVNERVLREHSLYEVYFAALQQILLENGVLPAGAKP